MCGICGALDASGTMGAAPVEALNRAQLRRGPDDQVVVTSWPFHLGNTRLAIQDATDRANQPFRDPTGRFTAIFNGEIYNFKELVRDHRLTTSTECDGEVIPLLWARYGPESVRLLRGMFAIAVADHERGELHLARDPFGIKPLYWRRRGDGVLFASDVDALWKVDRSAPVDKEALAHYFGFGSVAAASSPYVGIEALAPGSCLTFSGDGSQPKVALQVEALQVSTDDEPLAAVFQQAVELHLRADVPTALLLSAGIDSSLVALAAHRAGHRLHCLTVSGPWGTDESPQAARTAATYGHSHEVVPAELDHDTVERFFAAMPRPTIDGLNSFLVNRAVHQAGFKVALSGLGADEVLGGYGYARFVPALPLLRAADLLGPRATRVLLAAARRRTPFDVAKLDALLRPGGPRSVGGLVRLQRQLFSPERVAGLLGQTPQPPAAHDDRRAAPALAIARAEASHYLEPTLLQDADAFSMAWSVELRVPFVDRPFVAAALRRRTSRSKRSLVSAMGDPYLERLSRRPKTGFSVPMREWIERGPLRPVVAAATDPDAPLWGLVDRAAGLPILQGDDGFARWSEAWALAALDGWLRAR